MAATVQSIFQDHFDDHADRHVLPPHRHKLARALMDCRTARLGGHVQRCPHGCVEGIWYNACRHRACPLCSTLPTERWPEAQKARLLDGDHYHVIFTLPHPLNDLWWYNNRRMADILFASATATLRELLADPRYPGAAPGLLAALHTRGRNLSRHPHPHVLVTGGGWHPDQGRIDVTRGYLLPFQVVRKLFRGKFLAALRKAHAEGALTRPPGLDEAGFNRLLDRPGRKLKWNVHIRERYPHGAGVATYLARYLRGGPLNNRRILHASDREVVFDYTDHRDKTRKSLTLTPDRFIERLLRHAPEPGRHMIRHYGLYHASRKETRAACRQALGQAPEAPPEPLDWQEVLTRAGQPEQGGCPVCGARLVHGEPLPRQQSPPRLRHQRHHRQAA